MVATQPRKTCRDCREALPLDQFPPNARTRDGRASYCRPCINACHKASRDARRGGPTTRHRNPEPAAARTRKWCPDCQQEKPAADFGRNKAACDGLTAYCRPCHGARSRASYIRRHGSTRTYHLKRRYGLTAADVDALVAEQGGQCAVCGQRPPQHVDHDHDTGRVRGVLCSGCNRGLGNFRDDALALQAAARYVQRSEWQRAVAGGTLARPRTALPMELPPVPEGVVRLIAQVRGRGGAAEDARS